MLAVHRPHDHAFERQAHGARHQHAHDHGRQHGGQVHPQAVRLGPVGHAAQHRRGHIGADGDEEAMPEVQDVHQAEHQCPQASA
ncbi:hypothetical protein G6F31_020353 [Rhizopus arrhizus]|nr:hypothetical protein G6F31_020353 [Rhizopus arrhizus]